MVTLAENLALDLIYDLNFDDREELAQVVSVVLSVAVGERKWVLVEELLSRVQSYSMRK